MKFVKDILKIFLKEDIFFSKQNLKKIKLSFILYFIISILEFLSLGFLIIVILSLLNFENSISSNFQFIVHYEKSYILMFFLIFIVIKYLIQIFLYYFERKIYRDLQNNFLADLIQGYFSSSNKLFKNYDHANVISNIILEVRSVFISFFRPSSDLFSEFIVTIFLLAFLIYFTGIEIFFGFLFVFLILIFFLKKLSSLANKWGKKRVETNNELISFLGGLLNNFSLIKIYHKENFFIEKIKPLYNVVTRAEFLEDLGQKLFRAILEFFVIVIFLLFLFFAILYENEDQIISKIITLFVPFLRIVPGFLKINSSLNKMLYAYPAVIELKKNQDNFSRYRDNTKYSSRVADFNNHIKLKNIFYEYKKNKPILNNLNLFFEKNKKYLILGSSGSGKTTLGEILIGLKDAGGGTFEVDNKFYNPSHDFEWKNLFSYVPQEVFLLNKSIRENIAFGENFNEINENKVLKSLQDMNLVNIEPDYKIKNFGKNLSGGQKQRIGICRALYFNKKIIVLDEPTSALNKTDSTKIIRDILNLEKTIIVISHDQNIIPFFENIINFDQI